MRSSLVQKRAYGLWPGRVALLWTSAWHAGSGWGNRFRKTRREARGVVASAEVEPGGAGARAGKEGRYRPDTSGRAITGEATASRIIAQTRSVVGGCRGRLCAAIGRRRSLAGTCGGGGAACKCLLRVLAGAGRALPRRSGADPMLGVIAGRIAAGRRFHGNLRRPRPVPWERRPLRDNGGGRREAFSVSACVRRRRPCPGRRGSR
jgi:hypothetical protein